jgi:hypothetical protein
MNYGKFTYDIKIVDAAQGLCLGISYITYYEMDEKGIESNHEKYVKAKHLFFRTHPSRLAPTIVEGEYIDLVFR